MCLADRKPLEAGFPFRDQDTGDPLDMAPKIWMWEVPMMPKDPTPAQGIQSKNAIDHVYLRAHNQPESTADQTEARGEAWTSEGCSRSRNIFSGFFNVDNRPGFWRRTCSTARRSMR